MRKQRCKTMGASMAISAQGSPTVPQAARLAGIAGQSRAPNASLALPAPRRVGGNHDTLTALHCNDPRADRGCARAITRTFCSRWNAALVYLVSRNGLHQVASARRKVHLSAGQHVRKLPKTARGEMVMTMTRLLICTATILALTASANAQNSYFGPSGGSEMPPPMKVAQANATTGYFGGSSMGAFPGTGATMLVRHVG
jgi:hypothetical protein